MAEVAEMETQNNINIENKDVENKDQENKDVEKKDNKKKVSRLEGLQNLKRNPPELPFGMVTLQLQAAQMLGRLIHVLNDPMLFNKFKQTIHKKFELTIENIDNQINDIKDTKGGSNESYFTQEECSFF